MPMTTNPICDRNPSETSPVSTCPSAPRKSHTMSFPHRTRLRTSPIRTCLTISTEINPYLSKAWKKPICISNDRNSSNSNNSTRQTT